MQTDLPQLVLYNSETRQKSPFVPRVAGRAGLYVCGMTVYDYCHVGHARVMVAFDVLVRQLRRLGYQVDYVRNITDVDDKIIRRAQENGETIGVLTQRFIDAMHEDGDQLGCLRPDQEPRATAYIPQMLDMIGTLTSRGHAYAAASGDVYYAVDSFAGYGRLSGRRLADMQAGARVEVDQDKRNPLDFVLWKSAKSDEPHWASPWGNGRPGWHIECSAMATCCLGNGFDIHGGGGDLLFPHHENEIAQSEGATGERYVNTWMHVGFVNIDGEKMSKSLDNFFTIREVLQQFNPEVLRYLIVASHYRSPLNYSDTALRDAKRALDRFYQTLKLVPAAAQPVAGVAQSVTGADALIATYQQRFDQAILDDINTPEAIAVLFELTREINRLQADQPQQAAALSRLLVTLGQGLGLLQQEPAQYLQGAADDTDDARITQLIAQRQQAKLDRNWAEADRIRQQLTDMAIILEDSKDGTSWRRA